MTGRWPFTVQAAYFGLTLEAAFGAIGLAGIAAAVLTATMNLAFAVFAVAHVAVMVVTFWVVMRFPKREPRVRWTAAGLQAATVGIFMALEALDAGPGGSSFPWGSLLIPALVVAMLLTPPAARWFQGTSRPQ